METIPGTVNGARSLWLDRPMPVRESSADTLLKHVVLKLLLITYCYIHVSGYCSALGREASSCLLIAAINMDLQLVSVQLIRDFSPKCIYIILCAKLL